MDKKDLEKMLQERGIPRESYSLMGGLPNECFCINKGTSWEVYYSEHGIKTQLKVFCTENDACQYLYNCLLKVFGKI
ncbi:MAG: hypothetical protein ACLU8W_02055 [Clostridia bacterium]